MAARVIEGWYRDKGREIGIADGRTGSITAVQRFGSDLALNVHFHMLFADGVYDALGAFTPIEAPTRAKLEVLCASIAARVQKLLERRAIEHESSAEQALALALSRSAARRGTNKHAPEGIDSDHDGEPDWKLKARVDGFDLEATTVVRADDRERLENLCRYLLRPPLADRRLRLLPAGQLALELKSPWKDGTRWISMSADTFLERLSSLVPRPRTNQVLYRGVLAAHCARRASVVPEPDDDERRRPKNATFCELMKHGLGVDVLACPCGHRMLCSWFAAHRRERRGDHLRQEGPRPPATSQGLASPARAHPPSARPTAARLRLRALTAAVRGARAKAHVCPEHGRQRA
ncbi:MAG: transposase [Sandaracinus sp.]